MEYGKIAIRRAQEAGVKVLVQGSGNARNIPDGFSREEAVGQLAALCRKLAEYAAGYDVCIVIEPLQSSETNFINTVREGTEIAEAVNHPNLGVLADFFHMLRENEDAGALSIECKWENMDNQLAASVAVIKEQIHKSY